MLVRESIDMPACMCASAFLDPDPGGGRINVKMTFHWHLWSTGAVLCLGSGFFDIFPPLSSWTAIQIAGPYVSAAASGERGGQRFFFFLEHAAVMTLICCFE